MLQHDPPLQGAVASFQEVNKRNVMMTITARAVTISPHEISASIVFFLSKPLAFPQPLLVAR
jgi:hypothetical protein